MYCTQGELGRIMMKRRKTQRENEAYPAKN